MLACHPTCGISGPRRCRGPNDLPASSGCGGSPSTSAEFANEPVHERDRPDAAQVVCARSKLSSESAKAIDGLQAVDAGWAQAPKGMRSEVVGVDLSDGAEQVCALSLLQGAPPGARRADPAVCDGHRRAAFRAREPCAAITQSAVLNDGRDGKRRRGRRRPARGRPNHGEKRRRDEEREKNRRCLHISHTPPGVVRSSVTGPCRRRASLLTGRARRPRSSSGCLQRNVVRAD